jgi:alpha-D-ribose 1-methylphosphonate 5-triphosphate synthase subunit PhnL
MQQQLVKGMKTVVCWSSQLLNVAPLMSTLQVLTKFLLADLKKQHLSCRRVPDVDVLFLPHSFHHFSTAEYLGIQHQSLPS